MIQKKWLYGLPMPFYFLLLALLLYLLPGFWLSVCRAQGSTPPGTALAVGQPVPDITLPTIVNYPKGTAKLSDFRGKLLLLEFWATWCGNCKETMPKLDALQQQFGDQVQVLLVNANTTKDTRQKVEAYFDRWRRPDGTRYQLPSVVHDTALIRLFPNRLIPHVVWVGPEGDVRAITGPEQVTPENVRQVLAEKQVALAQKKDVDLERPLYSDSELPAGHMRHYSILLKGLLEGVPSGTRIRTSGGKVNGAALTNTPLLTMYQIAKRALYPEFGGKGLVLAVEDSARLLQEASTLPPEEWLREHVYSYDLVVPVENASDMFRYMLDDLNRYSGYQATLEPREQDCLLLVRKGRKDRLRSKGGTPENKLFHKQAPFLRNMPLTMLVARLNSSNGLPQLVVDKTGYTGQVDLELEGSLNDLPALRRQLQRYGLDLVPARREVNVLVLREN